MIGSMSKKGFALEGFDPYGLLWNHLFMLNTVKKMS